ncbi:hypothetical protein CBF45_05220 [Bordetella sp. J329]|nr:hypothetical protein CBF45_05220 [Bordetella sp. J329]
MARVTGNWCHATSRGVNQNNAETPAYSTPKMMAGMRMASRKGAMFSSCMARSSSMVSVSENGMNASMAASRIRPNCRPPTTNRRAGTPGSRTDCTQAAGWAGWPLASARQPLSVMTVMKGTKNWASRGPMGARFIASMPSMVMNIIHVKSGRGWRRNSRYP